MMVGGMLFEINGVNGINNYRIPIRDGRLVLIGRNGSGKTTICQMIQLFLSGNWYYLAKMSLSSIKLVESRPEGEQIYCFDLEGLKEHFRRGRQPFDEASVFIDDVAMRWVDTDSSDTYLTFLASLERGRISDDHQGLMFRFDDETLVPFFAERADQREDEYLQGVAQERNRIQKRFGRKVLYLPTYRRIEARLDSLLRDDARDSRSRRRSPERDVYFENGIIHFGMSDVENAIKKKTEHLQSFSLHEQIELTQGYLHSILRREYQEVDEGDLQDLSKERVWTVLHRIERSTLTDEEKEQVASIVLDHKSAPINGRDTDENRKIILHYFTRLQNFYRKLQNEEEQVNEFCHMCNKYLSFNEITYDESSYSCRVESIGGTRSAKDHAAREISLESLSSGEKQIVGLFSKLILEDNKDLFIIVDEPEISLSVDWQRTILTDVVASRNFGGLIAATHSPFVFDNELVACAHSLNEFMVDDRD